MNLLAHSVLSPPNRQVRVGNVMADFIHRKERARLSPDIQLGIQRHLEIDAFTDRHPTVSTAKSRLIGFKRFGNPLVDVFFDHFLVRLELEDDSNWIDNLYRDLIAEKPNLPDNASFLASKIIEDDWLSSYASFDGLERALTRMERRIEWGTGREVNLIDSLQLLRSEYTSFESDFKEFWPELFARFGPNEPIPNK